MTLALTRQHSVDAAAVTQDMPASLFGYDVIQLLGRGAGSVVYAVSHPDTGQLYALKQVSREKPDDTRFVEQITNEYAVSRNFRHPGLRRCTLLRHKRDWSFKVSEAALMMELIDGQTLHQAAPGNLSTLISCFSQAARHYHALHAMGYIHCDIKPANIMLTGSNEVRIIDFGQTCRWGTVKTRVQGTPDFIAPEQTSRKPLTIQTDLYCFGATMYTLLTGRTAPTLCTLDGRPLSVLLRQAFPTPRELRAEVPHVISQMIMRCLSAEVEDRPNSMADILPALSYSLAA